MLSRYAANVGLWLIADIDGAADDVGCAPESRHLNALADIPQMTSRSEHQSGGFLAAGPRREGGR